MSRHDPELGRGPGRTLRGAQMHHRTHEHGTRNSAMEMRLYTRYEHGNLPVRVYRGEDGETRYAVRQLEGSEVVHPSARRLIASLYGHDVHMPFDRYFRLGRYRRRGRASGQADLLTLLGDDDLTSRVVVDGRDVATPRETRTRVQESSSGGSDSPGDGVVEFLRAMEEDLRPLERSPGRVEVVEPTGEVAEEFERAFALELDRLEGRVGIRLEERSSRSGSRYKADEVRRLLWKGFAGKMLSQGYDPDDVLQEVYRGLLVRNRGRCPFDGEKSSFGHYVHMVISCVLTNYHRKQVRRMDRDAVSLDVRRDGEEMGDVGQWGSCTIEHGSEVGEMMALQGLAGWLEVEGGDVPEAELGRRILPLVVAGHQRGEIVRAIGAKPSLVSRALAWLRRQTARWAQSGGLGAHVPERFLDVARG